MSFLYEEKAALEETGDGFIISTERVIGADAAETNLVRAGDTLTASTTWINTGNTDLIITGVSRIDSTANATISSDDVMSSFFKFLEFTVRRNIWSRWLYRF